MSLMQLDQHSLMPNFSTIWEDFFGRNITDLPSWRIGASLPAVNIEEKPDKFSVSLAVPGMKREDFKIAIEHGILSVALEKRTNHEEKGQENKFTRREFSYQAFKRAFTLPESVKAESVSAKYEDGILSIDLPKREEAQIQPVKQIKVE